MSVLDNSGLAYFWGKVKAILTTKADLISPTFTGTPAAPTASTGTNTTQIATTAFVQKAISGGGGGALIIGVQDDGVSKYTLNKTWQEIYNAVASGRGAVVVEEYEEEGQVVYQSARSVITMDGFYEEYTLLTQERGGVGQLWFTNSANGYPTFNY